MHARHTQKTFMILHDSICFIYSLVDSSRKSCGNIISWDINIKIIMEFPGSSAVKNPPAMQEMLVRSLGGEDCLKKEMATHLSILVWRISCTKEFCRQQFRCCRRVGHDLPTKQCSMYSLVEFLRKSSIHFIQSVMSDSLWPHRLQHARLPCPSPTPRACSNLCPSCRWYHPTISSSIIPFFSLLQSFPALGSFLFFSFLFFFFL